MSMASKLRIIQLLARGNEVVEIIGSLYERANVLVEQAEGEEDVMNKAMYLAMYHQVMGIVAELQEKKRGYYAAADLLQEELDDEADDDEA